MSKKPLKVFFAYTQNMAVAYYRFISYAKHMSKQGAEVAYSKWSAYDDQIVNWQYDMLNPLIIKQLDVLLSGADITVMGGFKHPMGLALIKAAKQKYGKPILMEMDDFVMNLPGYNTALEVYKPNNPLEAVLVEQMKISDGMIVSTPKLKEMYSGYNKNIYVVPNGVDVHEWGKLKNKNNGDKVVIGFTGSPNHIGDIRLIKKPLQRILDKYPNVELYFWGSCPDFFEYNPRVTLDDKWIPVDQFPRKLAECGFDIALAPLRDNNFNRGKSNLRYLEASMLKVPVVASPLDDYKRTIIDGKNGFLCNTEDEWFNVLSKLVEDEKLRKNIGIAGYANVVKNFALEDMSNIYIDTLEDFTKSFKMVVDNEQADNTRRDKKVNKRC